MRDRFRSPPRGPPLHGRHEYAHSHRRSVFTRSRSPGRSTMRAEDYSPSHRLRERQANFNPGASSTYSEMDKSMRALGSSSGPKERRDYVNHLDGDRDGQSLGLSRFNEDLSRRDTASMKFQCNHLFDHSERINVDGMLGSEHPSGSIERTDYRRNLDGDRDRQSWKMPHSNEVLPQRDSASLMFQRKHVLSEREKISGNANHSPKFLPEYGGNTSSMGVNTERNYQDSRYEDPDRSRMMVEKPIHVERDLHFPGYSPRSGNKRNYLDIGGGGTFLPLKKFSGSFCKDEEIRFQDHLPADKLSGDKLSARELYKEEDIPRFYSKEEKSHWYSREEKPHLYSREEKPHLYSREEKPPLYSREGKPHLYSREEKPHLYSREGKSHFYSKDTSHYVMPSSQSNASVAVPFRSSMDDFCHTYKDIVPVSSGGYNSSGFHAEPLTHGSGSCFSNSKSFRCSNLQMEGATNYEQVKLSPNVCTRLDYYHSKERRSDYSEMVAPSDKPYGKRATPKDDFRHLDSLGSKLMEPIIDGPVAGYGSRREHLTEDRLWDDRCSPLEQKMSNHFDAPRSSYVSEKTMVGLAHRPADLEYEREVYRSPENMCLREEYGYGRDAGLHSNEERMNSLLMTDYDKVFDGVDQVFDGLNKNGLEEFDAQEVGMLKQPKDIFRRRRDIGKRLMRQDSGSKFSISRKISGKVRDNRPNKSLLAASRYRNTRAFGEMVRHRNSNSFASGIPSVGKARHLNSRVRDIKKRLGPVRPVEDIDVAQSTMKNHRPRKVLRKNRDGGHGDFRAEEEGPSEPSIETAKSEPSEKSEEFKQLVRSSFFKFVKQLNENTAEVRKFKEQGKAGSLKCCVCGSHSEDFSDTESLVMHACTSTRVGFKAQHLGFHKALCALMGWKAAEMRNSEWVCLVLSDTETVSLKEDLIIWPPVVIIHNSSIGSSNPDGRVVVSIEGCESMIRDLGFGEKTKVCWGKPANQSIMVTKFSGTFSGFSEAEKLHKFFVDKKHGRTEFQNIESNSYGDSGTHEASTNNMEDVLYGYLGIAKDLNKLDSETKKRCLVRSKKEIQDLAGAPLNSD